MIKKIFMVLLLLELIINSISLNIYAPDIVDISKNDFTKMSSKTVASINEEHTLKLSYSKSVVLSKSDISYKIVGDKQSIDEFNRCVDVSIIFNGDNTFEFIGYVKEWGVYHIDIIPVIKNSLELSNYIWWNSSYNYYVPLTIDHDKIDTDLIDFPVLVSSSNTTLLGLMDDGDSIRFIGVDNVTEYNYEIEYFDDTSKMVVWVNITYVSSSVDTVFNMYFNNSNAVDNQNVSGTWNNNYVIVCHMNESSGNIVDSNNNKVGAAAATIGYHQTGVTGYCVQLDGDSAYFDFGDDSDFETSLGTWEVWWNSDINIRVAVSTLISKDKAGYNNDYYLWLDLPGTMKTRFGSDVGSTVYTIYSDSQLLKEVWYYTAFLFGTGGMKQYLNSVLQADDDANAVGCDGGDASFIIGTDRPADRQYWWDGFLDEVRVSNIRRNSSWIKATYYSNLNQLISFGSIVVRPSDNFLISNILPVNNSEIECINLTTLCVDINSTFSSSSGWVNISFNSSVYYNQSFTGNDTYCFDVSLYNFSQGEYYIWYVNCSNGTAITNTSWFNFTCVAGCSCYDELNILRYKIEKVYNDMIKGFDDIEDCCCDGDGGGGAFIIPLNNDDRFLILGISIGIILCIPIGSLINRKKMRKKI